MFGLNPWIILAMVLAMAGATAGGYKLGSDHQLASQAKTEDLIAKVKEQAQQGAAEAISKNRPINQYNKQVLDREIRIVPDYSRCVHSPDGLQSINSALENKRAEPIGDGSLPGVNTNDR